MHRRGNSGKLGRDAERAAWTAHVDGATAVKKGPKYGNTKVDGFDSKKEARIAVDLRALAQAKAITEYEEQKRFVLVEGDGHIRAVTYTADFCYRDAAGYHVVDCKGFKTAVYNLKKRLMWLLLKIKVEEL